MAGTRKVGSRELAPPKRVQNGVIKKKFKKVLHPAKALIDSSLLVLRKEDEAACLPTDN